MSTSCAQPFTDSSAPKPTTHRARTRMRLSALKPVALPSVASLRAVPTAAHLATHRPGRPVRHPGQVRCFLFENLGAVD